MRKQHFPLFLLLLLLISCKSFTEKRQIKEAFNSWKENEIRLGVDYLSEQNCNEEFVMKDSLRSDDRPRGWGFPKDIHFAYGYLNDDSKIDAIVTFSPIQCDGGRLFMWDQIRLIALSGENGYQFNKTFFDSINSHSKGPIIIKKIKNKSFEGDYYEFLKGDAHCCPSIHKKVLIDFETKNVTFE